MPLTAYMEIQDIPGESDVAGHENEIALLGVDWRAARDDGGRVGRTRRRSRTEFSPVTVRKVYDASSPYLFEATAQGRSFPTITLTVHRQSGDEHLDYLTIELTNCQLTDYGATEDDDEPVLVEEIAIVYERIRIAYIDRNGDAHEIDYDIAALA